MAEVQIDVLNALFAQGNPYQELMYTGSRYRCVPGSAKSFAGLADDVAAGRSQFLHLHWDDRIFGRYETLDENEKAKQDVLAALRAYRDAGGKLLWTIHNALPHRVVSKDTFESGRRDLCDIASRIHVHTEHARDHMISTYGALDQKISIIPHPSYLGAYEVEDVTLARPLPVSDVRRFLMFGLMRGSKGINTLYGTAKSLNKRGVKFELEIRGKAFKTSSRMYRFLNESSNISAIPERVPDDEVAATFARAHFYVAPFEQLFTSGSIMLAQTFGLPVIGPDLPALRQSTPEAAHGLLYAPDNPRGLFQMMQRAVQTSDEELANLRQACFEFAVERAPMRVAGMLADVLDTL